VNGVLREVSCEHLLKGGFLIFNITTANISPTPLRRGASFFSSSLKRRLGGDVLNSSK